MTILFMEDWETKHPSAIVDYKTRNQEFVRLAMVYKEMGVENHAMILALHNPELQGIDPYNPPDAATAIAIGIEIKDNFWYFIREIARDPAGSPEHPILFKPNRGVIAAYWLYLNHIVFYLIMIRQTGKSFGIDWLWTWLLNFGLTKSEISLLTKDEKLRGREIERLKDMEATMPSYLKQRRARDPGNTEVFKVSGLDNYLKAYVPNKSPKIADQIGRGMTSANAGADELAYLFNNFITVQVMLSATQAAREVSRLKNEPYGTVFTTTTGKRDTPEGKYAYKLVSAAAIWTEAFFKAKNQAELYKMVMAASADGETLHVNCTFNHRQLGKTDDWLRARLKDAMQEDPTQIEADYLNLWPSGTLTSPFPKAIAEMIRGSETLDYYTQIDGPDCYALRWYYAMQEFEPLVRKVPHILGIDPSDAVNRDAIAGIMVNIRTGNVAMAHSVPLTNLIHYAMWLCDFIVDNPQVTVIVERRGSGATILDYLLLYLPTKGVDPFTRLYNTAVQDQEEYPERFKEIQRGNNSRENLLVKYKQCFGWATSGSGTTSRSALYSKTLSMATRLGGAGMKDRTLILQILGLVVRNDRVDHEHGEHDDSVIAWLLTWWLMTLGKHLSYYGIHAADILRDNSQVIEQRRERSAYEDYVENKAKDDIKRLTTLLESEKSEFLIRRYEYELEDAMSKLSAEDRQIISADDLIQKLREQRAAVGGRRMLTDYRPSGAGTSNQQPGYLSYRTEQFPGTVYYN